MNKKEEYQPKKNRIPQNTHIFRYVVITVNKKTQIWKKRMLFTFKTFQINISSQLDQLRWFLHLVVNLFFYSLSPSHLHSCAPLNKLFFFIFFLCTLLLLKSQSNNLCPTTLRHFNSRWQRNKKFVCIHTYTISKNGSHHHYHVLPEHKMQEK